MCLQELPVLAAVAVQARQQRLTDLHDDAEAPDDRSDLQRGDVDLDEQLGVITGIRPSLCQPALRGPHRPYVEGVHRSTQSEGGSASGLTRARSKVDRDGQVVVVELVVMQ